MFGGRPAAARRSHRRALPAPGRPWQASDDRDPGQRLLPRRCRSDPALRHDAASAAKRAAASRGRAISAARPRGAAGRSAAASPAGPDHVGADQHQQPRAQVASWARRRPPAGRRCRCCPRWSRRRWPPPLLPAVTGLRPARPARRAPPAAGSLADRVVQRERRGQHPGQHRGRVARSPATTTATGRGGNAASSCAPVGFAGRRRRRPRHPAAARRQSARPAVTAGPRRTGSAGSRPGIPPPAARPGRGRGRRAWKASTPAITSSVTGFR